MVPPPQQRFLATPLPPLANYPRLVGRTTIAMLPDIANIIIFDTL